MMNTRATRSVLLCLAAMLLVGAAAMNEPDARQAQENALKVEYLEIVTPSVQETCEALGRAHGVEFGEPVPALGNARTADLEEGGRIGVRAPLHDAEKPVVRPYVLVEDIEAAIKAATADGAKVMVPPMELPGQGTCALYLLGGIEHGLWQR